MHGDWSVELGADDPALEFPWLAPDGSLRYVDLQQQPERLAELAEVKRIPELGEFLRVINQHDSLWLTAKCDVWIDEDLGEFELIHDAKLKLASYIDLVAREDAVRFSFERHERWVKSAASALSSDDELPVTYEFVVRRCWFHAGRADDAETPGRANPVPGFYVTFYLFGYGEGEGQARACWAEGLRRVTTAIAALAP